MSVPEGPDAARASSRSVPLPEAGTTPDAEEILRESEERVAGAAEGERPADAADENRRSEETL